MSYEAYETWRHTPNCDTPDLSVIIPAYDEEVNIIPTICAIASHLCDLDLTWELIVADDGSVDKTAKLVKGLGFANLKLLLDVKNRGKGWTIRRGMLAAKGRYILFTDAKNSTPIEEIDPLLAKATEEDYDIVIGSRTTAWGGSLKARLINGLLDRIARRTVNIDVQDIRSSFKLFTREAAQCLFSYQTLRNYSFDLEILYLAGKFGFQVAEVPVNQTGEAGTKSQPARQPKRYLKDLRQIKQNDRRGLYDSQPVVSQPVYQS